MPGKASLQSQQYYAHKQNAFWYALSPVLGVSAQSSYATKLAALKSQRIAVWDVLRTCERDGSLDSNIVRGSEQYNDFDALLGEYPSLKAVLFNGRTAEQLFLRWRKHSSELPTARWAGLQLECMPSTSPAYASMTREQKQALWAASLQTALS